MLNDDMIYFCHINFSQTITLQSLKKYLKFLVAVIGLILFVTHEVFGILSHLKQRHKQIKARVSESSSNLLYLSELFSKRENQLETNVDKGENIFYAGFRKRHKQADVIRRKKFPEKISQKFVKLKKSFNSIDYICNKLCFLFHKIIVKF